MSRSNVCVVLLTLVCLSGLSRAVCAQSVKVHPRDLTRDMAVLDPKRATVYVCSVREDPSETTQRSWMRLYNNTVWTLQFFGSNRGEAVEAIRLSNGSEVPALKSGTISYPVVTLWRSGDDDNHSRSLDTGFHTSTWLPPGSYTTFAVDPRFGGRSISINYRYEWELSGMLGRESYGPQHSIVFHVPQSKGSGNYCP